MSIDTAVSSLRRTAEDIVADASDIEASLAATSSESKQIESVERVRRAGENLRDYLRANGEFLNHPEQRHQFRNLLNRIAGPSQLLLRKVDEDTQLKLQELLGKIEQSARIVDQLALEETPAQRTPRSIEVVGASAHAATILVAEDDDENRLFLEEVLQQEGHTVVCVADGNAALALAESSDFDLILIDLGLPRLSGLEVLARLQNDGWNTPIIVVTGRRGVNDAVRCIERGADDFLTKPIQVEILRARINSSIEKIRLREREFAQLFPPKLARQFARRPSLLAELPSHNAEVSILFCDIRNFSHFSEKLGPEITTRWLRDIMHELCEIIIDHEGVLVDFAGDEIMAMWGAPEAIPDHAQRACRAAAQIMQLEPRMSAAWQGTIGGTTELTIGISSGVAMVGHVGTARKLKYGALGDAVNIASRVLGATNHLGVATLISGETWRALSRDTAATAIRRVCTVKAVHIAQPIELYEMLRPDTKAHSEPLFDAYAKALSAFEVADFERAIRELDILLKRFPNDGPTQVLRARALAARKEDSSTFDPTWQLMSK